MQVRSSLLAALICVACAAAHADSVTQASYSVVSVYLQASVGGSTYHAEYGAGTTTGTYTQTNYPNSSYYSTVEFAAAPGQLSFSFDQNFTYESITDVQSTEGEGIVNFIPGGVSTYSIASYDLDVKGSGSGTERITTYLYDQTSMSYLYQYHYDQYDDTLSSSGSSSGSLNAADKYQLFSDVMLTAHTQVDPSLTGTISAAVIPTGSSSLMATPEPSGIALLGTGLLSVLGFARKRMA